DIQMAKRKLVPLQERSIYFLAPESDGAVFRLHSNIVVSSLRWRNDLSLSEKTINVSRWGTSTTVVLMEKAIAFCNDKTETWLDVAFANKTKPKYESTEQLVAKGLFPGAVALPEPSRASQSPAAFECSQVLEGTPPLFSEVRRDSLCPHDG